MANIILIGFMGSGKSAVGKQLAQDLDLKIVDTDELIEQQENCTISELFRLRGEPYFRDLESKTLESLSDKTNLVIATGGGMVLRPKNVTMLKKLGSVVLLWADAEVVYERIKNETKRPLLKVADPLAEIKKILGQRAAIYRQSADFTVETFNKDIIAVVKEIKAYVQNKG